MVQYASKSYILKHIYWVAVSLSGRHTVFRVYVVYFRYTLRMFNRCSPFLMTCILARALFLLLFPPFDLMCCMKTVFSTEKVSKALFDSYFYIYLAEIPNFYLNSGVMISIWLTVCHVYSQETL